jgi:hypothetical protein
MMIAEPTQLAPRSGRQGRQPRAVEELRDNRDELIAHRAEALKLVDDAWPHVSALQRVAVEIGPLALKHALELGRLLRSYERRHSPEPPAIEAIA